MTRSTVIFHDGCWWTVTATVDEDTRIIYDVTIWRYRPSLGTCPFVERFSQPINAFQRKAYDEAMELYKIDPVLEKI